MNEGPTNPTKLLESWRFCSILWDFPHFLWTHSHYLPHFNLGLFQDCPSSWFQAWGISFYLFSDLKELPLLYIFGIEGTLLLCSFCTWGVCVCVFDLQHTFLLAWNESFSFIAIPSSPPRHRHILVKIQIKVHRKEGRLLSNVLWLAAWILSLSCLSLSPGWSGAYFLALVKSRQNRKVMEAKDGRLIQGWKQVVLGILFQEE